MINPVGIPLETATNASAVALTKKGRKLKLPPPPKNLPPFIWTSDAQLAGLGGPTRPDVTVSFTRNLLPGQRYILIVRSDFDSEISIEGTPVIARAPGGWARWAPFIAPLQTSTFELKYKKSVPPTPSAMRGVLLWQGCPQT